MLPRLFQLLMAAGFPWLVAASLQSLPPFSRGLFLSVCLCVSVSYKDTLVGFRAHPNLVRSLISYRSYISKDPISK